ncbi:RNA 2',3'-cyclic phosphodiesterase [Neobacillus vireti]|uniref:RNA 2',3'-cyclic phosphodiesterase n=1 Tax=Neobacillus vireti TaxID=220686 RepID=UPI002FFDEAA2
MNQRPHYFFAVRIPETTKLIMKNHIESLQEKILFSRWVHHLDLHITLAFLGSAEPENLKAAENYVKESISSEEAFTLKVNKLGIFGRADSPRVFWADTESSDKLAAIRKKVFSGCERAGFQLETRPFKPHITLARKWKGQGVFQKELLNVWDQLQPEPLGFKVEDVVVYQTHLDQTPKYEAVTIFPLQ